MPFPDRTTWPRWARVASSAWIVSPIVVFALLFGAFFAYGAYTRSQPTHYARGGDVFGLVPTPTPSSSADKALAKQPSRASKHKVGHAAGIPSASRAASGTGSHITRGGSGGQSTSGATTRQDAPPVAITQPATGSYQLAVSGSEHVKFGPFSACTNTFPTSSTLVVKPASGEPAGSYDFDLSFYPSSPNRHDERHIYRYGDAGVNLTYEEATVTCGGIKQSSTVNYSPPQQRVKLPLSSGESWSTDGGDGNRTERGAFQVLGTDTVTIAGHSYQTWVIDTHVSMSGSEAGSRDQRWWWSPQLGIPVKWHESLSGKRSGATYSEDVTVSVVGLP
jgi:hypothetical protein